jgi:hypothetical protein
VKLLLFLITIFFSFSIKFVELFFIIIIFLNFLNKFYNNLLLHKIFNNEFLFFYKNNPFQAFSVEDLHEVLSEILPEHVIIFYNEKPVIHRKFHEIIMKSLREFGFFLFLDEIF